MVYKLLALFSILAVTNILHGQARDTTIKIDDNYITLSEVVVNNNLDVASFIKRIKTDTTFYKAFKNLRVLGYRSINDIRMLDKKGNVDASLNSKTRQFRTGNCRMMSVLDQKTTGDFFDRNGNYNYYTAQMYAGLFFTKDTICGETNIVKGYDFSADNLSGMEKHKEQLKMLFFNPGRKIKGIPFISNKTAIFDESMADKYDMSIDYKTYMDQPCYVFAVKARENKRGSVVVNEMVTWFSEKNFEIVSRNYSLSYDAGVYDFNVSMEVQMTHAGDLLVPAVLKYNGNWKAIFKKRERGVFTATLYDFE